VRCAGLGAVLALILGACGGDAGSGAPTCKPGPAPANSTTCEPRLPDCWAPGWKPPRTAPHACTEAQIVEDFAKCWESFDPQCDEFQRDPANAACLKCLFSTRDEPSYGAILLLSKSYLSNVPGCMALIDGDTSSTGCAAKYQAYFACVDDACGQSCISHEQYSECTNRAASDMC